MDDRILRTFILGMFAVVSWLLLFGCGKPSASSFWIEENQFYDSAADSAHSALVSIENQSGNLAVTVFLRGKVLADGNREILEESRFNIKGTDSRYVIDWKDSKALRIRFFQADEKTFEKLVSCER